MVFASQVYPTAARSLGMGFCTSFSRIGGMIAPFIAQVSSVSCLGTTQVSFQLFLPSMFDVMLCVLQVLMSKSVIQALSPFAVACVVCALGNFLLPIETKGRALLVRKTIYTLYKLLLIYLFYISLFMFIMYYSFFQQSS